jgi:16S rRNA processing protein RimM
LSEDELVTVGRVGRPHGVAGAFVVEAASDEKARFAVGATLIGPEGPVEVVESKVSGGRRVIRTEPRVERGADLRVARSALEKPAEDEYYVFQLVGLSVEEEGGRVLGRVKDVANYPANDVLELDTGVLLPLVEACVREVDLEGERILVAAGFAESEELR